MKIHFSIRMLAAMMLAGQVFAQDSLHVTRVGYIDTPGLAEALAVGGNYAYIADNSSLRVINITNPALPVEVGFCNPPGREYGVAVAGNYVYVADDDRGLRVIDVTNPAAPTEVGFYDTPGDAQDVTVAGNYAYVADGQMGLRVVNVTNPSSPVEVGFYDTPGSAWVVAVQGNYAYIADYTSGLRVIDITIPTAPMEVGFYETPRFAWDVAVAGNYAYVANSGYGLQIIDITNPAAPTEVAVYDTPQANGVAVAGTYAYVAGGVSGLRVIDIMNPALPMEVGFYEGSAERVVVVGNYAYVVNGGLAIYDISYFASGLRLLSPNGGESLQIFSSELIYWARLDSTIASVHLELNRNYPGGGWETLADTTENDGEWTWFVTDPPSNNCRIRIAAIGATLPDVSDTDFSIVSSQGYLVLVRPAQPTVPVLNWSAGVVECGNTAMELFMLKNVGSEPIVIFQPLEPPSDDFSRTTDCEGFVTLAPGEMSACNIELNFHPTEDGIARDTLRVQTDAVNGVGGYVKIPLAGEQITTPAAPEVVIQQVGQSARLSWDSVEESIGGCPITVTHYLLFFSEVSEGPFWYLGGTEDTTFVHTWAIAYAPNMFYNGIATMAPIPLLQTLPESPGIMTREEVLERLKR